MVYQRWSVAKLCVKDSVCVCVKVVCGREGYDKVVCERWCVTKWCVTKLCASKMVCDKGVCERWCVTRWWCDKLVCQRWCGSQPSATSATPATQNENRCHKVPRLPRKVKIYVAKCHACHANGGVRQTGAKSNPSMAREPAQCHKCDMPATPECT